MARSHHATPQKVAGPGTVPTGRGAVPLVSGALPALGHLPAFMRDATSVLRRGYAEHGRLFGLRLANVPTLVMLDPEHRKEIVGLPEETLSIAASYPFLKTMFGNDFYFMAETPEYQRQRALYVPVFRGAALHDYLTIMESHTRQLVRRMGEAGELDIVGTCAELNLRIIADTFFGPDLGHHLAGTLATFEEFSANVSFLLPPWMRPTRALRSRTARRDLHVVIRRCLAQRRAHPRPGTDFLQSLCESHYPDGRRVPDSSTVPQALGLVWAARETTSGQLAWAMADLLAHPEHQAGLLAEQRHLAPGAALTTEGLHRLTGLDHLLYESERLHPLAILIARRALHDLHIGTCRVPRGTMVLTSPYLIHRLPEEFPDPEAFRPGRYAEDPQAVQRLLGFGAGIHRCLGQRFARLETKVLVTLLLQHFHMELLDTPVPVTGLAPRGLSGPCRMRYRRRTGAA
ncbi:cytochrome P450 [Streptomyces beigongshangae]|uniref:cytochrome P450 n=1 Tax=Streptomyces beigongshangae TaxID=2841597 RepID=UPI001C844DC7|nr:cytochrome P450 [Streptomyces sp. REN17]